jgi:hypothetical protein
MLALFVNEFSFLPGAVSAFFSEVLEKVEDKMIVY